MTAAPPSSANTLVETLSRVVPGALVTAGTDAPVDLAHDEALGIEPVTPAAVVHPRETGDVARLLAHAHERGIPVTARGSGTGLSGAAVPRPDGILVVFDQMAEIVEIDADDMIAVVQPGVTLERLDAELAPRGLVYPVFPGEYTASLGGNVATNAGGMRAVKYGVTRHQVLGLEAVLPGGEVIRTGGRFVKGSSGYDLTQLIVGSEGTLAVVTEAVLRLHPRCEHQRTVLAPFATLAEVTAAVPSVVNSGVAPYLCEYIDLVTMAAMVDQLGLELGVPAELRDRALAYLVIGLESHVEERVDADVAHVAEILAGAGALDVFVLPHHSADALIGAREKAFWLAKGAGAHDIVDVVVPRSRIDTFMSGVSELATAHEALVAGCGHAGDGNVHLSVFQPDAERRRSLMKALFALGSELGGAVSGEHGLGRTKAPYWLELEDPAKIALMRRIKTAFDPRGILNPGAIFGPPPGPDATTGATGATTTPATPAGGAS